MSGTPAAQRRAHAIAIVFAGCAVAACSREHAPPPKPPAPVTVAVVATRDMPVLATAPGNVEAINSVAIKSLVDGQLLEAKVADGADVEAGQLLFRIDPRPAQAALQQAIAQKDRDQATLGQAQSQVQRYQDIARKGFISADQMEQYRTNLEAARAQVKVDEANVAAARVALTYTEIHAPIAGRIGRVLVQAGNLVKANDTTALVTINQIRPIYVSFALPSSLLGRLRAAQDAGELDVAARVEGVPAPVRGTLAFIDNAVDTATGTVRLRGRFDNDTALLWPGQLVGVSLTLGHDPSALVVPDQAVQNGPDGTYVYVVHDGSTAEQRSVTVARVVAGDAVITRGVSAGETVVLDGQSRVEDKAAVKVSDASP